MASQGGFVKKYIGGFKNDMRSGFGLNFNESGQVYIGEYQTDKCHGFGMLLNLKTS